MKGSLFVAPIAILTILVIDSFEVAGFPSKSVEFYIAMLFVLLDLAILSVVMLASSVAIFKSNKTEVERCRCVVSLAGVSGLVLAVLLGIFVLAYKLPSPSSGREVLSFFLVVLDLILTMYWYRQVVRLAKKRLS